MKRIAATIAALTLALSLSTPALCLTIPYEDVRGYKTSSFFGWGYAYSIGFIDDALRIDVDLMLSGATQGIEGLMQRWETGIESIWSTTDRFAIPILFNVDFLLTGQYDLPVRIAEGYGRWNTGTWYTSRANDDHERAAAHEFGHFIQLYDEYAGGAVDPVTHLVTNGLMGNLSGGTLDHYYQPFLSWYDDRRASYGGGDEEAAPVPEPGSILLLGIGLLVIAVKMKRRRV